MQSNACRHRAVAVVLPIRTQPAGGDPAPPRPHRPKRRFALRGLTYSEKNFLQATLATARGLFRTEEAHYAD